MKSKALFSIDFFLIAAALALMIIGILFIYSSNITSSGVMYSNEFIKQIIWAFLGIGILFFIASFDYQLLNEWSPYIYVAFLVLLMFTLSFGKLVNGARAWLGFSSGLGIQPSEFTKVATILVLARFLEKSGPRIKELRQFIFAFILTFTPVGLIILQPDLGTSLVFIPIFIFMLFTAGARARHIVFLLCSGSILILFTTLPAWEHFIIRRDVPWIRILTDMRLTMYVLGAISVILIISAIGYFTLKRRYYYWIIYSTLIFLFGLVGSIGARMVLKEYQLMRLIVFLDPSIDPKGSGWNVIQSVTAVGSGGFFGKGYLQGTQSHYRYLPEQSTDFIFSIISEEWGFLGCAVIFILFFTIILRSFSIVLIAKDSFAVNVAAGITGMFFFHVVINTGMAIGIMPVTGIPLFFLSYGGSSLWTALTSIGLLLSIHSRRFIL